MTDAEFLLEVLRDGEWHSLNQILARSFEQRGHGLTVHSRAADLRDRGHVVEHRMKGQRGAGSQYRLLSEAEPVRAGKHRANGLVDSGPVASASLSVAEPPESLPNGDAQLTLIPERRGAYREVA